MAAPPELSTQELPLWMRQARRRTDWGIFIVIAFALAVAWAFIVRPGLPRTNASENYVYRTNDYAAAFQENRLYPRWSANALNGYGAPIPSFYPPAAAYTGAVIQVLFTDDPVTAVRLVYILALCLAGSMMYVFVTRWTGSAAGILASTLYLFSPYVGLVAPHVLGDLPGVMSLALIPGLLWSLSRLLQLNRPFDLLAVSIFSAGLFLTEIRAALVALALAAILVMWQLRAPRRKASVLAASAACGAGVCLSAFFWVPALLEQHAIHWRANPVTPPTYTLSLSELLSPLRQVDPGELVVTPQFTLGTVGVGFALLGGIGVLATRKRGSLQALFLVVGLALTLLSVTVFSSETWLLGPITLCLVIGGSGALYLRNAALNRPVGALQSRLSSRAGFARLRIAAAALRPQVWQRRWLSVLLIIVLIVAGPVWLSPDWPQIFSPVDPISQLEYEEQGFGVTLLPPGAPIPATIPDSLPPSEFLLQSYLEDQVSKIEPDQLSGDLEVNVLAHRTHSDVFQIRADKPAALEVLTGYFPGWQATLDGRAIPVTENARTNLLTVAVPRSGDSELVISLETTFTRSAAWIISWTTLTLLALVSWRRLRASEDYHNNLELLTPQEARLPAVIAGAFVLMVWLSVGSLLPTAVRAEAGYRLDTARQFASPSDNGFVLLAYEVEQSSLWPGDMLRFTLYWHTLASLEDNLQVRVSLWDTAEGLSRYRGDLHNPGGYPTRRWPPRRYVADRYSIDLPADMIPGSYQIAVEAFACDPVCSSETRLIFSDPNGTAVGRVVRLPGVITVQSQGE